MGLISDTFLSPPAIVFGISFVLMTPWLVQTLRMPKGRERDNDLGWYFCCLFAAFIASFLITNPVQFFQVAFGAGGLFGGIFISVIGIGGVGLDLIAGYQFVMNVRYGVGGLWPVRRSDIFSSNPTPIPEIMAFRDIPQGPVYHDNLQSPHIQNGPVFHGNAANYVGDEIFDEQIRRLAATERAPHQGGFRAMEIAEDFVIMRGSRYRHRRQ